MGKIILASLHEEVEADEVWIIMRSIRTHALKSNEIHVPELSPSEELLKKTLGLRKCYKWGRKAFDKSYW